MVPRPWWTAQERWRASQSRWCKGKSTSDTANTKETNRKRRLKSLGPPLLNMICNNLTITFRSRDSTDHSDSHLPHYPNYIHHSKLNRMAKLWAILAYHWVTALLLLQHKLRSRIIYSTPTPKSPANSNSSTNISTVRNNLPRIISLNISQIRCKILPPISMPKTNKSRINRWSWQPITKWPCPFRSKYLKFLIRRVIKKMI